LSARAVSQDAYVSIRDVRQRPFGEPSRPRPVVFVDLDSDDYLQLRGLPPILLGQVEATLLIRPRGQRARGGLLARALGASDRVGLGDPSRRLAQAVLPREALPAPDGAADELRELLSRWGLPMRVAVLTHPIGAPAEVEVIQGQTLSRQEQDAAVAAARAVELEALLHYGRAIWRPSHYHYRLPSGEHAASFVKLADAIRSPRDADVLATWLAPHLEDGMGMVLDTGTLTPLAQAVALMMKEHGLTLGPITTLDRYPRAGADLDEAIDRAAGDLGRALVIVSVSSSGGLLERIHGVLGRKGSSLSKAPVVVLVSKTGPVEGGRDDVWSPVAGQQPLVEPGASNSNDCELCRDTTRSRLIPINPFSFDGMLQAQVRRIVPSLSDPTSNRELWEAAAGAGAVELERPPHDALQRYRSSNLPMPIVFRVEALLDDAGFRESLEAKIRQRQTEGLGSGATLILVPAHEANHAGYDDFWELIKTTLAPNAERVSFELEGEFSPDLRERVREADEVLIFCLGTVTGASLQRALVGVQSSRDPGAYRLRGFVVHARPPTGEAWRTLRNSFGRDGELWMLHCGWYSVLPERSPLRSEQERLKQLDGSKLSAEAEQFLEQRLKLTNGDFSSETLFIGQPAGLTLTPNSIYGQSLDAVGTYVAVISALTAGRHQTEDRASPELRVFDVAAMARSYYDPLIICSFLRWLEPHDIWWGWREDEATATVQHLIDREEDQRSMLVLELLLAAAEGKLTRAALEAVNAYKHTVSAEHSPALEVLGELAGDRQLAAGGSPMPADAVAR